MEETTISCVSEHCKSIRRGYPAEGKFHQPLSSGSLVSETRPLCAFLLVEQLVAYANGRSYSVQSISN